MLPDRVSNPGPLTYESGALPSVLRGPADLDIWCHSSKGKNRFLTNKEISYIHHINPTNCHGGVAFYKRGQ